MSMQFSVVLPSLLAMVIVIAVLIFAVLWKKGKTVEAMLVLNALLRSSSYYFTFRTLTSLTVTKLHVK